MEETLSRRLYFLMGEIWVICHINEWLYSSSGKLLFTTENYSEQMQMFLKISGSLEYAMALDDEVNRPFVLSNELGMVWIGEKATVLEEEQEKQIVLMGPIFNSEMSQKKIHERISRMNLSVELKLSCIEALQNIPIVDVDTMRQYGRMLHLVITGEIIGNDDFICQNNNIEGKEIDDVHFTDYEFAFSKENLFLQYIREGNLDNEEAMEHSIQGTKPLEFGLGDPVREGKDNLVRLAALGCRAAIEGGATVKAAKSIEKTAIQEIEKCTNIGNLMTIRKKMVHAYIKCVSETKSRPQISQPIQDCCRYIQTHITEELNLGIIARNTGYSEYYLSRKFSRETGYKIFEYIRKKRIEYAKVLLMSSGISVQSISEKLQFSSRNYFSKVFKEEEGVTPVEFREKYLKGAGKKD